ncbi:hypothetical protein [Rhizobium sp. MHM7A]|uniref:hypothetical protein n=1 Tax=Rhizobium sp. MHM7A TaxID=2583233 RepID=UPI001105F394|nr:hypothetical protein [Rhizobium sp. MHM7A]TLX12259.1 hypothetical protein FFR93_17035 [Rhizobium sp. MHM7A]
MTPNQDKVDGAARWLLAATHHMPNVICILRQSFGLSAVQAAQACTLANKYRIEAHQLQDSHVTSRDVTRHDGYNNAFRNVTPAILSADSKHPPKGAA